MENNVEKIKALFNDEKRLKEFLNRENFLNEVCENKATPERYVKQFREFGIEITEEESKEIQKSIEKIINTPPEEIDDNFLKNISGGCNGGIGEETFVAAGAGMAADLTLAAVSGIGACACIGKAVYAHEKGGKHSKLKTAAWATAATALGGLTAASVVAFPVSPLLGLKAADAYEDLSIAIDERKKRSAKGYTPLK